MYKKSTAKNPQKISSPNDVKKYFRCKKRNKVMIGMSYKR